MKLKKSTLHFAIGAFILSPVLGMKGDDLPPLPVTVMVSPAEPPAIPEVLPPVVSQPSPPATPASEPRDWSAFTRSLKARVYRFPGTVGYIVEDLQTGRTVEQNAHHVFLSASLIKLPILAAAFEAVQEGRLSLSAEVTLRRQDREGGSGILKFALPGTVYTMRELLEDMIIYSDNTATKIIVQRLGYDYLQNAFDRLGLHDTVIRPDGFQLKPRWVPDDNLTSPRDMAYLLSRIYRRRLVSPEASDQMLDILKHQKYRDRLPRYLPAGWQIAHKTGLLRRACHDCGIVFGPDGDYVICVLTAHDRTYRLAKNFIASLGRISYDYYEEGFHRPITRRVVRDLHPAG